jgi:hypothetical protein
MCAVVAGLDVTSQPGSAAVRQFSIAVMTLSWRLKFGHSAS